MSYQIFWMQTQQAFHVDADESVLDAATRQGVNLPHECTFGGCGSCRIQVVEGHFTYPDGELPLAMTDEEHAQGYALSCQARAQSDLVISLEDGPVCSAPDTFTATVAEVLLHTPDIYHLALDLPDGHGVTYAPGQYLNVLLDNGEARSFSMSSPLQGNRVTLQIRKIAGGRFTSEQLGQLQIGDPLQVELPHGSFYHRAQDYQPMVFAATGTGLAPIKAILESLLDDADCPPIHFYWGMRSQADLYLLDEIQSWASRLYEFTFVPVLSQPSDGWSGRTGYVQDAIAEDFEDLSEHAVYLCGSPSMIQDAKALLTLSGARMDKIYSDSFVFQNAAMAASTV